MIKLSFLFTLFATLSVFGETLGPDTQLSVKRVFSIHGKKMPHSVTVLETIRHKYNSKRSVKATEFLVVEDYLGQVKHLSAVIEEEQLKKSVVVPQLEDVFYSDLKVHKIHLPTTFTPGSELKVRVERKYKDIAFLPVEEVPNVQLLKEFILEYKVPKEFDVDFEIQFARQEIPIVITRKPGKVTLTIQNIAKQKEIPYFPFNGTHAWIVANISVNENSVSGSTPESFSDWYLSKMPEVSDFTSEKYQEFNVELQKKSGELDKLRFIHRYIQNNIRYMASFSKESSIIPRPPNEVFSSRFGDCKDRALLFQEIAKKEGLAIDIVLISTEPMPDFESVRVNMFDHAICSYGEGENRIYFDPTNKYLVDENLSQNENEKRVLVLGEKAGWFETPPARETRPSLELKVKLNLNQLDQAEVIAIVRKDLCAAVFRAREELTPVQVENLLSNAVNSYFRKLSVDYFQLVDAQPGQMVFKAIGDFEDLLVRSTSKCYFPVTPFLFGAKDLNTRSQDPYALFVGEYDGILEIEFLHEGYVFDRVTKEISSLAPFAEVTTRNMDEGKTVFKFEINTPFSVVDQKKKQAFLDFNNLYLQYKNAFFTFRGIDL